MYMNKCDKTDFEENNKPVQPIFGLFFHGSERDAYYVTKHDVDVQGKIKAGAFVEPDSVKNMVNDALSKISVINHNNNIDFIPEHVLVDKPTRTVWYRPASTKDLLFKFGKKQHTVLAALPSLLFIRDQTELRIFALNSNERPTPKSKLFHAPLMNINGQGSLCLGDAILPESISAIEETLVQTEECFFNCYSGHINHQHTLKNNSGSVSTNDLFEYFTKNEKNKVCTFNTSDLMPTHKTLQEVL